MAELSYFIRSKSENASIYCRLTLDRKNQFDKKTGFTIDSKYWSTRKKMPKQTVEIAKKRSEQLKGLRRDILDRANDANAKGKIINPKWLEHQLDVALGRVSETGKDDTVIGAIETFIKNASNENRAVNTIKKYKYLKGKFEKYQSSRKDGILRVGDIDRFFADDFLEWLKNDNRLNEGTANKILRTLITVCKQAEAYGLSVPASLINMKTKRHEKAHKIYLTPAELLKIEKAVILAPYLQNARRWLLLGCEIGQRVSDLPKINPSNVIEHDGMAFLRITTQKTQKEAIIPIVGKIKSILGEGFPRSISSQNLNKYIKEVCKIAKIDTPTVGEKRDPKTKRLVPGTYPKYELVTSHCMRYSFVTNSKSIIDNRLIRSITKHSTDKMMESYNAVKEQELNTAKELGDILQRQYDERPAMMKAN